MAYIKKHKVEYFEDLAKQIPHDESFLPNYWYTKTGKEFLRENPPRNTLKQRRLKKIISSDRMFGGVEASLTQSINNGEKTKYHLDEAAQKLER